MEDLREYIKSVLQEARDLGEVELPGDVKAKFGSDEHVKDLVDRIDDLIRYRKRHKRGSAQRDRYTRAISALKAELQRAQRANEKQ